MNYPRSGWRERHLKIKTENTFWVCTNLFKVDCFYILYRSHLTPHSWWNPLQWGYETWEKRSVLPFFPVIRQVKFLVPFVYILVWCNQVSKPQLLRSKWTIYHGANDAVVHLCVKKRQSTKHWEDAFNKHLSRSLFKFIYSFVQLKQITH